MALDVELRYERLTDRAVGVQVVVEGQIAVADSVRPYSPKTISNLIKAMLAIGLQIDEEKYEQIIRDKSLAILSPPEPEADKGKPDPLSQTPSELIAEANAMLENPNLLETILDDAEAIGVARESDLVALFYLIGTSRLLVKPLAATVTGSSSTGKSYVMNSVAKMFPAEAVYSITSASGKALNYIGETALSHRWVVMGEQARVDNDESEDIKRTLRELLSEGETVRVVAEASDRGISTREYRLIGPIAFSDTTTRTNLFSEDVNRGILLHPDESEEQTRAICEMHGDSFVNPRQANNDPRPILDKHHTLQRLLEPHVVAIPYGRFVSSRVTALNVEMRRALELFFAAIQACTLLHQRQRQVDERGFLIATSWDYAVVQDLLQAWLSEQIAGDLGTGPREFLNWLRDTFGSSEFTIGSIVAKGKARSTAKYNCSKLSACGVLATVGLGARGRGHSNRYRIPKDEQIGHQINLPTVDEISNWGVGK